MSKNDNNLFLQNVVTKFPENENKQQKNILEQLKFLTLVSTIKTRECKQRKDERWNLIKFIMEYREK